MAAAIVARAESTLSLLCSAGFAGSSADDNVGVVTAAAAIFVIPVEGSTHVPPGEDDELVPGGQHIGVADVWEANVGHQADVMAAILQDDEVVTIVNHGGVIDVGGAAVMVDDAHSGVEQGEVDDLEGAVAVEKQPRGTVASVTGEVEPRPVAVGVPKTEGVRHAHVAAPSDAVGRDEDTASAENFEHIRYRHACVCNMHGQQTPGAVFVLILTCVVEVIIDTTTFNFGVAVSSLRALTIV